MGEIEVPGVTEDDLLRAAASVTQRIAKRHRHLGPPEGAFSVEDYVADVEAEGGEVSAPTALRVLKEEVVAGRLHGQKFLTDGRPRWWFWE